MATTPNHDSGGGNQHVRRFRFDPTTGVELSQTHSGRRFVTIVVLTVLVAWGSLYLVFRDWRARVLARAAYGAREVAPIVDPMAQMVPQGASPGEWRDAVEQTHALLVALTAANLLDQSQMQALRAELAARVATARPETAREVLRSIWDDMCARAGPVVARRPLPKALEGKETR